MNYLTHPHWSAKYLAPIATPLDFNNRRALILDGSDDVPITLTTVRDLANIVAKAVEYDGEWPLVSGISGETVTAAELIAIGERVRGTFGLGNQSGPSISKCRLLIITEKQAVRSKSRDSNLTI